jgi:hypothetical protein
MSVNHRVFEPGVRARLRAVSYVLAACAAAMLGAVAVDVGYRVLFGTDEGPILARFASAYVVLIALPFCALLARICWRAGAPGD